VLTAILEADGAIPGLVGGLSGLGLVVHSLAKEEPTLEDVFVKLVGRTLAEDTPTNNGDHDSRNGTLPGDGPEVGVGGAGDGEAAAGGGAADESAAR